MRETVRRLLLVPAFLTLGAALASPAFAESLPATVAFSSSQEPKQRQSLEKGWLRDHFALRLRGIEYRHAFAFRRQRLRFHVSGPVVRGNPGMRVEVGGWLWGETEASFSAYGNTERQGFKLSIDF